MFLAFVNQTWASDHLLRAGSVPPLFLYQKKGRIPPLMRAQAHLMTENMVIERLVWYLKGARLGSFMLSKMHFEILLNDPHNAQHMKKVTNIYSNAFLSKPS